MNEPDPLELAALVAASLEQVSVRNLLGGSLASTALGEPRATVDVDIVASASCPISRSSVNGERGALRRASPP